MQIQLSETSAQIQHFQDVIKSSSENHQRIVRSLEQKISNQKEEILVAHKEVESVKQEFENYKVFSFHYLVFIRLFTIYY